MKRTILFLVVFILSQSIGVKADEVTTVSQRAEAAYMNGDFKLAVDLYQQLLEQEVKNSEIYFNLGNAYYQLHDLGRALVNYRRAEIFLPRDEDLWLNIELTRVQRVDGIIAESGIAGQVVKLTSDWISVSELAWIIIILWWMECGCIAAYLWRSDWRKWIRWAILITSVLFVFVGFLALTRIITDATRKPVVVVSDSLSVMTGPGINYVEIFELHAAAEIRIVEERNHWVRFQLPDLREGWIDEQFIEAI